MTDSKRRLRSILEALDTIEGALADLDAAGFEGFDDESGFGDDLHDAVQEYLEALHDAVSRGRTVYSHEKKDYIPAPSHEDTVIRTARALAA